MKGFWNAFSVRNAIENLLMNQKQKSPIPQTLHEGRITLLLEHSHNSLTKFG